jgi:membrane-associated phospholipid phosphatase
MRATERLAALAVLLLSAVLAALGPPGAPLALAVLALTLAAAAALALLVRPGDRLALLRDVAPFAVMVVVFSLLQPAIEAVNAARYDALLDGLDARWFEGLVVAWRGTLGRPDAFTDGVYLAYVSFYLFPVVVLLSIRARTPDAFERASFTVLLGFFLSYVGYFLWPAYGPRLPAAEEAALGGGAVSRAVRTFLHASEGTTLDAFPSGHTAMSLLTAHVGARRLPRATPAFLAWAAAIVFATVYIHVHYVVDLVAGAALYGCTLLLARPAMRLLGTGRKSAGGSWLLDERS